MLFLQDTWFEMGFLCQGHFGLTLLNPCSPPAKKKKKKSPKQPNPNPTPRKETIPTKKLKLCEVSGNYLPLCTYTHLFYV